MKVLKAISALPLSKCVLGQYIGDPENEDPDARLGYLDDKTVPEVAVSKLVDILDSEIQNPHI